MAETRKLSASPSARSSRTSRKATHLDALHSGNLLTRAEIDQPDFRPVSGVLEFLPSNKRKKHPRNLTTLGAPPFACGVSR
jgi:hypothetical protein